MRTVYGANGSPFVRKVCVMLAEKGLTYEQEPVIPLNVSAEFKKLSPLGKIPAYRDGEATLSDSSIICAYLERKHPEPSLYPSEPYEYARALWFEEYGDTALSTILSGRLFFQKVMSPRFFNRAPDEAACQKVVNQELPPLFDYLESQLGADDAIIGKRFSIGDIGIATQFVNFQHAGYTVDAQRWPKLARYVAAVLARPSFKRMIEAEAAVFGKGPAA
jgi:glutathione S-transferase